ncbi:CXXC-type zinc finger protein 1-like [Chironomus tepperi]|uniref:CXXC-type zinc finger protein 1-like n=1 Tax=Chironomus tepperi TaxID=113505 RepID=UPI00391F7084
MDSKKFKTKEEIAKEFDNLPERKSKIATILKEENVAYCICRSSKPGFMICCDFCEEWYHGDCIGISEKESKSIKKYYCDRCKADDPTLKTLFKPATTSQQSTSQNVTQSADNLKKKKDKDARCGNCEGCRSKMMGKKGKCEKRLSSYQLSKKKDKKIKEGRIKKRKRSVTPELVINPALEGPRHCLGPECRYTARPQSKYCSDICGMKLASNRIFQILPTRIQEWSTPSIATEQNKKSLEKNRAKQQIVRATLMELDKRHRELDLIVETARQCTLEENAKDREVDVEDESSMYCVTCGHEIHARTAIRHMERCFNKYESQASFGSIFKTRIEGNSMFCDFYNVVNKTYCKRLRVLCPEHSKDPKVTDTDVCGCPLTKNVFELIGEFCRAPKKSCFKHYCWEKIRRAEIDLERVRQWMKMDELVEQERQIKQAMASRSGLMGLLLHSSYDHERMERIARMQAKEKH